MEERLSRDDLGIIQKLHDEYHYRDVSTEYVDSQLKRIGLSLYVSRFGVAKRIKELEREICERQMEKKRRRRCEVGNE